MQEAAGLFEERMGPIVKAIGDRNDRADVASRLKWKRSARRQERPGLLSGDRVLLRNTQVTASTIGPFAPEMYEVTQTMGALLRIRSVGAGNVKTVRNENCKLRPHAIAVSDEEGEEAKRADAAALQLRATGDGANVAVLQGDQDKPATTTKKRSEPKKKPKSPPATKAARGGAKSTPGNTSRVSNEKIVKKRFRPPGFTKFDQRPSRPKEFAGVEAGALRHPRAEYNARLSVTAAREVLTLVGDETTCVLKVDGCQKSRRRRRLSEVRRRVAAGEAPILRLPLKALKGKGYRGANKVVLRLNPRATPDLKTYSKIYQKKTKLKPMALPPEAG